MDRNLNGMTCILKLWRVDEDKVATKDIEDDAMIHGKEASFETGESVILLVWPDGIDV